MGSLGGSAGSIVGGGLGSFLGPVGTVVGGMAGGLIGNAITGGGQNQRMPAGPQQAQIDPGAQTILNTQSSQAMQTPEQASQSYANQLANGVGSAGQLLTGGGRTTNPMQSALANRQQQQFAGNENNQYRTNYANGPVYQMQQANSATSNEQKEAQAAMGYANASIQANQNNQAARNGAINSILQNGGAIGGLIGADAGQGQAGAQQGANIGGMLGNTNTKQGYLNPAGSQVLY